MINNRQAGRRRGRGGQRQGGNPGRPDNGNRIDSRARGNAAQLLEKYKSLARDAQMAGDRVNTEYYLQFADHYFRVLSEQRGRFEEQNQQRRMREDSFDEDDGDEFDGESAYDRNDRSDRQDREERQPPRYDRQSEYRQAERSGNQQPSERSGEQPQRDRVNGRANGYNRDDRPRRDEGERIEQPMPMSATNAPPADNAAEAAAPRRRGRPKREVQPELVNDVEPVIEADRLPPALARPESSNDDGEAPTPRPRRRRVRAPEDEPNQSAA